MSADALMAMNQMLDSWSIERLSIFSTMDQQFMWPSGQVKRTLGPTGDFAGVRPVAVDGATYFTINGISYPIDIVNDDQYNSIILKTVQSPIPQVLYVNADFPNITMYLYPVPNQDLAFHFISVNPLTQPAASATVLSFPPGYLDAFTWNLAVRLAPEFGVEASPSVKRFADISKRALKRINNPEDVMGFPAGIITGGVPWSNIFTG